MPCPESQINIVVFVLLLFTTSICQWYVYIVLNKYILWLQLKDWKINYNSISTSIFYSQWGNWLDKESKNILDEFSKKLNMTEGIKYQRNFKITIYQPKIKYFSKIFLSKYEYLLIKKSFWIYGLESRTDYLLAFSFVSWWWIFAR